MKTLKSGSGMSRRSFLNRTSAGALAVAFGPAFNGIAEDNHPETQWTSGASGFRFHMIGHAHIDPVWLWPWEEGIAVVHSTFRSALDRMMEVPDFTVIASSAQFYSWVAENDPSMLAEIRQRVEEGRWNIVGGWWVEPDVNLPSGEALVRQGLYGQLTFQRLLGRRATIGFNPDSFGHTGSLPQIIKQQGMDNYSFMRPAPHEKSLPADLFWWEGIDGTRVLTYRIPISYNESGDINRRLQQIKEQSSGQPVKSFMAFYGVGDHGGGPTRENIKSIEALKREKGDSEVFYSTPERYFKEIREQPGISLPVVKDDLQHHARGCYTAESEIKKGNRQAEAALVTAEKIASLGAVSWGVVYPKSELTSAWQRVLFLQFHDSLAGTSLVEHSATAREGYGYALDIAHRLTSLSLQKLEWQVPSVDPDSQYMLIFNPHAWETEANLEYDFNWGSNHSSSRVEDELGHPLLHQWVAASTETGSRRKLAVRAKLPPMGYRQLRLMDGDSSISGSQVHADRNVLENEHLQILFSSDGSVGIFDKETGEDLFAGGKGGCRAVVIDDPSDTWSHDIKSFSEETGVFGNAKLKILENGPLRATVRVMTWYGDSVLSMDWALYSGSWKPEVKVTLDWHERLKMLKFSFPLNLETPVATYEIPFGTIERAVNGEEEPGQRWVDVSGMRKGNAVGLAVVNDAKYGYSISGNDLRISVARSAVYAHHNPKRLDPAKEYTWMDQGIQTFRMLLVPHRGSWRESNLVRIAEEFIAPPPVIYQGIHGGSRPKSGSFLHVDPGNILVSAVKTAEEGDDLIVRCVEASGVPATATVDLPLFNTKWTGVFRPGEIKTLRINRSSKKVSEVNLLEE